MTKSFTLNNSRSVIGFISGLKSRITPFHSRVWSVLTLTILFSVLGGFSMSACADNTATITRRSVGDTDWSGIVNGNSSSAYITWKGNDTGTHVTFKLSGGTFKNSTWDYFQSTGSQTHKLEWTVDDGYTVSVKSVSLVVRSSMNESTVKVGQADYATNPYGGSDDFAEVSSGTYSPALGNDRYVNIIFTDGYSLANNFIKTLTVTYTIEGVGSEIRFSANSSTPSFATDANPYYLTQDSVRFKLDIPNYNNDHFYVHNSNDNAFIKWEPNSGFSIAVTGVTFNGCNATYYSWGTKTGSSWIKTYSAASSSYSSNVSVGQNTSTYTTTFTTSTNTTVFPSGNALGNSDYFNVFSRKKDTQTDKADGSKAEFKINYVELSYRVTPPAPTRINSTPVTRPQYVEGRTGNTVDLTDYFRSFNAAVSMSYVVKKKNGSGEYETIPSGYDITDDVFKTSNVGEYRVYAATTATGAFTASALTSDYVQITIEEVQPLTVSVGALELYVDETTTMTIIEQLNTTEDVVFDYDDDFFDYNSSTGVLTIKNDGNASFNTIEKSIHITQASDGEYAAVDIYKVFTIKKHIPEFTWNAREHYYYNDTIAHFFKSSNTATAITVTSTDAHKNIATIVDSALVTYNVSGTARVTMTQAENYYWAEHTEYRDITPEKQSNRVTFTYTKAMYEDNSITTSKVAYYGTKWNDSKNSVCLGDDDANVFHGCSSEDEDKYVDIKFEGIPDTLSFNYAVNQKLATGEYWYVKESANGTTWSGEIWHTGKEGEEFNDSTRLKLQPTTRYIRLCYSGNFSGYYRYVTVTELKYFKTDSTAFDFKTQIKNANVPSKSFKFKHANAGYTVTATSSDATHYKVSLNAAGPWSESVVIPNTGGDRMGTQDIYVKYYPALSGDVEETHNATITFSDQLSNSATVSLTGKTQAKLTTTLEYIGSDSYSVNADNIAATSLFQVVAPNGVVVSSPTIKLTSSDSTKIDIIHVDGKDYIDFLCRADDVRITASYAGDATYAAASDLGQSITVNKVADEITWGAAVVNDTLRVYADQDIAYSLATAHTSATKPITYMSGDAAILRVTPGESSDALHTLKYDTVSLTATTTTDCFYSSVSSSIVVVVLPCKHRIVWNQTFGYHTEADGTIDKNIVLNAYAVDSTGARTNVDISYTMPSVSFARIDEGVLKIDDTGETTITARTATDNKYATAEAERSVIARISGENVAYAYNNGEDVKGGDIVIEGRHATFTISGDNDIYYYTGGSCGDDGYFLASLDKNTNATYTLSWTCDESCTIEVTNISFWAKAYNWSTARTSKARIIFNGKNEPVGTAALTCNSADYAKFSESGSFSSPMTIECQNTHTGSDLIPPHDFDFYLKNIVIEYTITAKTPTGGSETDLAATLSLDDKQTAALGSLFSMANPASDFAYEYQLKEAYTNAFIEGGNFYATYGGDYEVQSRVAPDNDHKASEWSTSTIHVTRTCVFHNTTGDKNWGTTGNWLYNGTPGTTDAVSIRANLTLDEQVEVLGMSIENGAVVQIAPTGGLTVGVGGISGATTSNLILKAGTTGDEKCQTGYLRISPEYDGDMPEAKVEMYTIAYHNKNAATGSKSFYQCMGAPISDAGVMAKTVFGAGSYLYTWNESTEDWTNSRTSLEFTPFKGFEVTQKKNSAGLLYTHAGHIVSGSDVKTIDLDYTSAEKGYNLLANSWTAPIDISQFETEDFVDATSTIYILNAGTKNNSDNPGESVDAPGKWIGVPIKTAAELAADGLPRVISSMQGFWVKANSGSAQLKLDYSRLVWGVNYSGYTANKPLRVQQRDMEEEDESRVEKMKINIYGAEESDVLFMLESNKYDKAYEDGYDAYKVSSEGLDLYSIEEDAKLSVDATYSISGTALGLRTGDETAYTFRFTRVTADKWALWDIETGQKIDINEGTEYTFFTEPDSEINGRFMIIEREEGNNTTTQIDNTNKNTKGSKFIKNDCLYILKDGKLYDTLGRRVR